MEPDPYMEEEDTDTDSMAGLDPSHPLLARAQAALKHQLVEARLRVEGVIREKTEDLKVRVCGTSHPVSQPHWASVVRCMRGGNAGGRLCVGVWVCAVDGRVQQVSHGLGLAHWLSAAGGSWVHGVGDDNGLRWVHEECWWCAA